MQNFSIFRAVCSIWKRIFYDNGEMTTISIIFLLCTTFFNKSTLFSCTTCLRYLALLKLKKIHKNNKIVFFRWAFKMYDKDGSGSIELPEMIEIIGTLYEMEGVPKVNIYISKKYYFLTYFFPSFFILLFCLASLVLGAHEWKFLWNQFIIWKNFPQILISWFFSKKCNVLVLKTPYIFREWRWVYLPIANLKQW